MSLRDEAKKRPTRSRRELLQAKMASGEIVNKLRAYLAICHSGEAGEETAFPNLAGFCRYLGVGIRTFCALGEEYPAAYDCVMTQLEDEALNAQRLPANSASLTAAYFKRRLGYDGDDEDKGSKEALRVVFEHDILEAGT
ncbi:MAG: hypothetical protein IJY66_07350 [Clostridia bacterium]|nr:hypothetical protein [Clostridia bacterium]